jgi:hypothetical protein
MNTVIKRFAIGCALLMSGTFSICAQNGLRGHWRGSVETPGTSLDMEVDLDQVKGDWIGSIAIPAQNVSGVALDAISFATGKCTFHIKGGPGDPTFTGTLSADGNTLSGDFKQGPGAFPFKFTRAGDPKVEVPKTSPVLAKEFLGNWEGTLEVGQSLRLVLKMSNEAGGAKAVLVSVDQGNTEIPVSAVDQKDSKLTLSVNMIGGRYEAEINKDGSELNGTWSQNGNDLPLKLKKASAK